jgi:hypothetical protein
VPSHPRESSDSLLTPVAIRRAVLESTCAQSRLMGKDPPPPFFCLSEPPDNGRFRRSLRAQRQD